MKALSMKGMRPMTKNFPRRQGGFSIVELMIGVALGLVILAALTSFFVSTSANRNEIERTSRQIENGRYAMDTVRSTLRISGFYAEMEKSTVKWTNPDPCNALIVNPAFFSVSPYQVPIALYGYADDSPAFPTCITDRLAGTDVLVVRRFNTEMITVPTAATPPYANQVFVQMSRCATDSTATPWALDYGGSSSTFALHDTNCANNTSLYQFRVEIYYVRQWSQVAGDGVPTLVKVDIDNKVMRVSPLVEGIQGFRIRYGIDSTVPLDGTPDQWLRCDTVNPCGGCNETASCNSPNTLWPDVTMLRVTLLAQNLEDSPGYTDGRTYDLDGYAMGPFNDHRKRHVFTTMVSLPNRTGPLEN